MIAGIGVDLTTVSRMAKAHNRFGPRLARRILHENEMVAYTSHTSPERFLAKRFAVKEAAVKALGTGERNGVLLRDFYLEHDKLGKPELKVSGKALERCVALEIDGFWVSLSDEKDTVMAFVVLEKNR
ncbi:MAG: holo-ACP synthase [Granulosicoccus sp.]